MQKGGIDMIVDRRQMRSELAKLLALLQKIPSEKLPKQLLQTNSSS
jgi:acetyl-CoA carboxylase beta subunit